MQQVTPSQLTLGPLLYLWQGEAWRDFYFRIADEAPVDHVVLGEVVCSKRAHFMAPYMQEVTERLQRAGKRVRHASLALVTLPREEKATRELRDLDGVIEISDLSALPALAGRPTTVGPLVNVYNAATVRFLASQGVTSICLPPELPFDAVCEIVGSVPQMDFEIFAFGRVPLAISARCAHARVKGNTKDNCQFVCAEDPDGLPVTTLEGQQFLALNGVQTMSHTCQTLIAEIPDLQAHGLTGFRLSPQHCDMVAVAEIYRQILDGTLEADQAEMALQAVYPDVPFSNGFLHADVGADFVRTPLPAAIGQ